jgi:hypothetical protein
MTIDLTALAQTITKNKQAEMKAQVDPARDKHWRRVGKIVRNDVKHTR